MPSIVPPCKLMVRGDPQAGVIRAWIAMMDESERFLIGTLDYDFAQSDRKYYDLWVDGLNQILKHFVEKVVGGEVTGFHSMKPDGN